MSSPIIFEKGTRDFSTLGLGLLSDAIQATTTEELNGQFIFEMDYPVSGNNADLIKENRIIVVNSGHILKRQGFIIRQIVRKIDLTMTVYAEHVSYATLDVALAPVGTISGDAKTALENWKRMLVPAVDFTVDSDILTTNSTLIGAPEFETARQGLGGHTGSILDVWGGEYQFDNWHIRLLKQRGKSANAIIAYGRNLISFEQDTNIADTYTSVYPYYQENSGDEGNKTHFLPERTVDSEFVGKYPNPKVLMLDLSNKFKDVADYSENKLRNYALSYIQSNNIGVPKVNMKISTVDLSRATGGFSEDIDLGDTVNVYFEKLGITTSAKVIKAVWNVLSDDYDKFEIGARRSSLTESISELATTADENANKALNQALVAQQSADGKTTIYYLDSSDPWPTNPKENDTAFVKDGENSIMYRYMFNNDTGVFSWVKILDSMSADQIKQRVSDALESGKAHTDEVKQGLINDIETAKSQAVEAADLKAKDHVEEVKQGLINDIETAKSNAVEAANAAQQNAIDVASKSLGTYLVRLLPGTNIFKTTNSTTIQAQVWKAGQDITSTLDDASFSWKIAKDGNIAISLTNNVKNVTAKPSDFNNTGTYIVNVTIPVTDTTGTTRNQTFSDSVTIAKVNDGADGNGISSTTITYATSSSGTNAPTSGYTSTIPTVNKGQFLWQRTETSYTNGTTKNSYVVTYFAKDGLNGDPGMDGGQGMIAQPSKPTSGLVDGFLWLDTSQTYPVYYIYDSSIKDFKIYQFNAKNIKADQIKAIFVGTDRLSASEIIADDLHVKSANIDGKLTASQITVSSTNGSQTSLADFNLGEISQTISDNGTIVNKLNQNNLVNNSQLNPDYSGWHITSPWGKSVTTELWNNGVESKTGAMWVWHDKNKSGEWIYSDPVAVLPGVSLSASVTAAMPNPPSSGIPLALYVYTYDANKTIIDSFGLNINYNMVDGTFKKFNLDNRIASSGAKYASVAFGWTVAGMISFGKPMLMFGTTTGDYVAGPYNNNDKIASQQITIDGISNFVRDSSGNLSSSFQTALSKTSLITGSTLASSIQTQTSSQISSALRDNNGRIISLINQDTSGVQISGKNITLDGNTTFTNLQNNVNSLGQVNLINNSNFLPDYSGWHVNSPWGNNVTNEVWNNGVNNKGAMYIWHDTSKNSSWLSSEAIPVSSGMTFSAAVWAAMPTVPSSGVPLALLITYYDANQKELSNDGYNIPISSLNGGFKKFSVENKSTPSGAKYVALRFGWSTAGSISFGQPMLVMSSSVGDYVAGAYNNNAALAQVKITADNISNFVRDSSGNISSDFQTALSKTSIITGSTLASSIQTQTSSQISSALRDNNGRIISLINQDSSGVQIAGKNLAITADTKVDGNFWAKQVNAVQVNASNITVGTLNGNQVNITNINANNIVSGAISGANLNINLNTGSVVFQKGRINSSDYTTDINIDQGYISTANGDTRALLTQGKLQLIDPNLFSPQTNPYLEISNRSGLFNGMAALVKARDSLTASINGYDERAYDTPSSTEKFVGLSIGKSNNKLMPTKIGGADQGVIISGGKQYTDGAFAVPYIYVGSDSNGAYPNGDRIYLKAKAVHIPSAYGVTWSGSANVYVAYDGSLYRTSSAKKYKQDIKHNVPLSDSKKLLEIPLSTWIDKRQYREKNDETRYFGMIAEDLRDAGLEYLVQYGKDNEVEGINYDRVALLLIPLVKELKERIEELESKGK